MLQSALKPIVRVALAWYYRSITVANGARVPASGPTFLAVNHPNALVDALVVGCVVPRRVLFTAKATIFANALAARFFRAAGVVPLRRASDERGQDRGSADASPDASPDASRNAATFDAVADALGEGACIVIFPEGKSHDAPQLAPLRTGLARMTMLAKERGVRGIRIVPIGLLFEQKETPRSRVLVQVGEPIAVDAVGAGDAPVAALTELVTTRLAAVTLNFTDSADAERIQLVGETLGALLEPARGLGDDITPLSTTLALVRRIDRALRTLRSRGDASIEARITRFEAGMREFRARLTSHHIDAHDLQIDVGATPGVRFALRELLLAAVVAPFVVWGRVTHWLPLRLARALSLRNVRARDEPAMRTVVSGALLVLLFYALLTAAVGYAAGPWWALLFLATLVPSATADFRYGDRLQRARARARAYRLFRRDPALRASLLADAAQLREEAAALEASA